MRKPVASNPTYAGWIPTIAGQLSFSLIGMNGTAASAVAANVEYMCPAAGHPRRHVAVIQKRITKDLPFTFWPIPHLVPSIAAHFLLVGETAPATRPEIDGDRITKRHDEIGVVRGSIYLIAHHKRLRRERADCVATVRSLIAKAEDSAPRAVVATQSALLADIDEAIQDGRSKGLEIVETTFELFRTGEFRLSVRPPSRQLTGGQIDQFCDLVARNAYYFAKDVSHRHYHHRARGDNLLPLVRTTPNDDEGWRRETLWSLMRAVLEMRRRNRLPGHQSAMGVLAYAEAFQGLLAKVRRVRGNGERYERTKNTAFYDFAHTRMSLTATIEQHTFIASRWMHVQGILVAVALAAPAIWMAALQVRGAAGNANPPLWASNIIKWCIEQPQLLTGALITLGLAYTEFSRQSLMIIPPVASYMQWLGGWIDAIGVSVSKILRSFWPAVADQVGSILSTLLVAMVVLGMLVAVGSTTHLWPWPSPVFVWSWLGIVLLPTALGVLVRQAMKMAAIN